jgi:putative nucleotidyltransferase with HDIG domain
MSKTTPSAVPKRPPSLDGLVDRIGEISTLPDVLAAVLEAFEDPNASAGRLTQVVSSDPALAVRVLRRVNSAQYALRSRLTTIQQAIAYLGMQKLRDLAVTASVSQVFVQDETVGPYSRRRLWQHMVAVAVCARLVATKLQIPQFETAFLAGLLHDMGIILEDQHVHPLFQRVIQSIRAGRRLTDAEQQWLGFDHTTLGHRVADKWRFPPVIRAAIRFHHMSANYREPDADLVRCVEVANKICSCKLLPSVGKDLLGSGKAAFRALEIRKKDLIALLADFKQELQREQSLFEMYRDPAP